MTIEVDNGWVTHNATYRKLQEAGYRVAGYTDISYRTGEAEHGYILRNTETREIVLDTRNIDELNNFVRLLIGGE